MDADMSNETYVIDDKSLILMVKWHEDLLKIWAKLTDFILDIENPTTKFK
jgi:hypothetical protein